MAHEGDYYTVVLKEAHLNWGEHRHTGTREIVEGEGYVPIPLEQAQKLNIINSNATNGQDVFGKNLFRYKTSDGYARGVLKAQGSSVAGSRWAKQFSQQGDLKAIGSWYEHIGAHVGTEITVSWVAPDEIELSYN